MNRISSLFALATLSSCSAVTTQTSADLKAEERGNGGKVLRCSTPEGTKVELLDLFEGREIPEWNLHLLPGKTESNYIDRAHDVIARFKHLDGDRFDRYTKAITEFESNMKLLKNASLSDISDVGIASVPENCKIMQLAIQINPDLPGQKLYTIDAALWEQLDEDNKAALVLHEIVYSEAKALGHSDSTKVRYFVANIMSKELESATQKSFDELLELTKLLRAGTNLNGFFVQPQSIRFHRETEKISNGFTSRPFVYNYHRGDFYILNAKIGEYSNAFFNLDGTPNYIRSAEDITYAINGCLSWQRFINLNEKGMIASVVIFASESVRGQITYRLGDTCFGGTTDKITDHEVVEFYDNGVPKWIPGAYVDVPGPVGVRTLSLANPHLADSGLATSGFVALDSTQEFLCSDGVTRKYDVGERLSFDSEMKVTVNAAGQRIHAN